MRAAMILYKGEDAGMLTQFDNGSFVFEYNDTWFKDDTKPPISLTLPKSAQKYNSETLFPFFFNMLPEGANKHVVCQLVRVDENDYFGLLLITAKYDTIGAVTVIKTNDSA